MTFDCCQPATQVQVVGVARMLVWVSYPFSFSFYCLIYSTGARALSVLWQLHPRCPACINICLRKNGRNVCLPLPPLSSQLARRQLSSGSGNQEAGTHLEYKSIKSLIRKKIHFSDSSAFTMNVRTGQESSASCPGRVPPGRTAGNKAPSLIFTK